MIKTLIFDEKEILNIIKKELSNLVVINLSEYQKLFTIKKLNAILCIILFKIEHKLRAIYDSFFNYKKV